MGTTVTIRMYVSTTCEGCVDSFNALSQGHPSQVKEVHSDYFAFDLIISDNSNLDCKKLQYAIDNAIRESGIVASRLGLGCKWVSNGYFWEYIVKAAPMEAVEALFMLLKDSGYLLLL